MTYFTKAELEELYNTKFTNEDVDILNERIQYEDKEKLKNFTKLFTDVFSYSEYCYIENLESDESYVPNMATREENDRAIQLLKNDSDDIALSNHKFLVMI